MSDTSNLRSGLIRLASSLPVGSTERRALLEVLAASKSYIIKYPEGDSDKQVAGSWSPVSSAVAAAKKVSARVGETVSVYLKNGGDISGDMVAEVFPNGRVNMLKQASVKTAHGPVALKNPAVMLYYIDPENNNSKFYEMGLVGSQGQPYTLQKRWGRLTDRGGVTGRVDSKDESFPDMASAMRAMWEHKRSKTSKGYQDVSSTREYPIGLGGAGFGWGGQVACQYIPELQALKKELEQQMSVLGDMRSTVDTLARKDSSMGRKLQAMVDTLAADLKQINGYLSQQLSECG